MRARRNRAAWLAGFAGPAVMAAAQVACRGEAPGPDPHAIYYAGGLYLEVMTVGEENLAVLYRVNGRRQIGFGGGMDAIEGRLSWVGELSAEEMERLTPLLAEHGWYSGKVGTTGEPKKRLTRVDLRWREGHRRFKVRGRSDDVEPIESLLAEASRRRLDRELEMLPR